MSTPYSLITIIYNPNSTGPGQALAEEFASKITGVLPGQKISLVKTDHTGHGRELAREIAKANHDPLIVSSSGDGGYHDVINGIMEAKRDGAAATAGLLPGGNANDHYENLHSGDPLAAIQNRKVQTIDLLKLVTTVKGQPYTEYAHSYIGLGFTPVVGKELNKTQLNPVNEVFIVIKELIGYKAVRIAVNGKAQTYSSLVFSNVAKMSKMFELSDSSRVDDGKFEITAPDHTSKAHLISTFLKASTIGLSGTTRAAKFEFQTIKPLLLQLDGETVTADARADVTVTLDRSAISCII